MWLNPKQSCDSCQLQQTQKHSESELEKAPGVESKSQLVLVILRIGRQSDVIVFKPLTKRSSAKPECELLWLSKRKPLLLLLHEQTNVFYTLVLCCSLVFQTH